MTIKNNEIEKLVRPSRRYTALTAIAAAAVILGLIISLLGTWKSNEVAEKKTIESAQFKARTIELTDNNKKRAEAERLLSDGIELASRGRLSESITLYNKAIDLNPQSANAYQFLGYTFLRRSQMRPGVHPNDLKDSISALEKAIQLDRTHVWARYNLALAYWEAGKKKIAIDTIHSLLEIDSSFIGVIANDPQFKKFRESYEFRKLINIP